MFGSSIAADASRVVTSQMLQVNGGRMTSGDFKKWTQSHDEVLRVVDEFEDERAPSCE